VPGGGAPAGSHWADLPKTIVRAEPGQTLREVLGRAAVQLGIEPTAQVSQTDAQFRAERDEPPRTLQTVDRLTFAAFRCPDDDEPEDDRGNLRRYSRLKSTAVAVIRDDQGHALWRRPPFTATMAELIDAAEAGLIDGDPLQPYLVLVIPQGELGALADWNLFTQELKLLWEVSGIAAQLGGAWGFFELVRKVVSRRSENATEIVERQSATWSKRGARPGDLIGLVRRRPQTGESIAALLGCAVPEAEAVLWAVGATETDGLWVYRGDPAAALIADDLQLGAMFSAYRPERGSRAEFDRRLEELGHNGEVPSADEEKRQMSDEFSRRLESEIDEEMGGN
jgi:hypothetical protein